MHVVNTVSMLVNAEHALRCKTEWVCSLSYADLVKRPVDVMDAVFELMGVDKTRVTPDMVKAAMQKDSQENSSISRKSLQEKAQMQPSGGGAAAGAAEVPAARDSRGVLSEAQLLEVSDMMQAFGVQGGIGGVDRLSAPLLAEARYTSDTSLQQ